MIQPVESVLSAGPGETRGMSRPSGTPEPAPSFAQLFGRALDRVGELQQRADEAVAQFVAGQGVDVHDVMIAAQEAFLALQLVVQIRDKAVEAYQEMMRMQI
ncbi:MAG: flagellar hook-basal body complex protein FliE [Alicyclobacillaceae bacterium]|nr:flagellar hook-basal body complex protein FliE [Alicyclobacillaceae bacterium]